MECLRILPSYSLHDTPTRTITTTTTHNHQPVRGTRLTLNDTLNDFYAAFLDDTKDGGGGGPVWSHLALIVGCAAPLWIDEWLLWSSNSTTTIFRLLPHVGILVLGVGDAAGAVVGVYWGRHHWPQSRRTMEGSLAMFVTMYLFVVVLGGGDMTKRTMSTNIFATLLRLTLLEASTSQIDNLCLPLVGVTSLLLHQP
jgi:dolichol kinase